MRAKLWVSEVTDTPEMQNVTMHAVSDKPFGPNGVSEDNDFARWTPSAKLEMTIQNPTLRGKIKVGQKFYMDFAEAT